MTLIELKQGTIDTLNKFKERYGYSEESYDELILSTLSAFEDVEAGY